VEVVKIEVEIELEEVLKHFTRVNFYLDKYRLCIIDYRLYITCNPIIFIIYFRFS